MKSNIAVLFLFCYVSTSLGLKTDMSPVTRVVELLKGLSAKIEAETKSEEELYETYVCWAKTVIDSKTASNEQAKSRKDSLEQYIDDLENGRIELTTERADLTKELEGLHADIESAEAARAKEHEDYLAAKDEMTQAIAALQEATSVLSEATQTHDAGLLAMKSKITFGQGFKARTRAAEALEHAVKLGDRFLSENDARFLRRILTGDVPTTDWKKLNRKATFKMKYKARSGKIQDVLKKLLITFQENLKETESKEKRAQEFHDKLMAAKQDQKAKASEALIKLEVEGGARGMAKSDAEEEVSALKAQIENDEKHIRETADALEVKKQEWTDRKTLRVGEVAAISKAISILHSDDARDLFKRSFRSQGYSFIQESQGLELFRGAAGALHAAAAASGDVRLKLLASHVLSGGRFEAVIGAIDKMIDTLKKEEGQDLENKESCEKDRAEDTRQSALLSRSIDELSDAIKKLEAEIEEIVAQIKEKQESVSNLEDQLKKAKQVRDDEHVEWQATDKDDKAAVDVLEQATEVLSSFYKENGMSLVQGRRDPPQVVAGEAPPPPPQTWEEPYSGKKGENDGIVGILEMIRADIKSDITKAKEAEDQAQKEYDTFKADAEDQIKALSDEIVQLEDTKAKKEEASATAEEEKKTHKGELDAVIKKMKDTAVGCNFMTVNFAVRAKNRQIEIDGLNKAKAILEGGTFEKGPDPKREMKPGDALLQHAGK